MISPIIDAMNIVLRSAQGTIFASEMEGVVMGFHCEPFPLQRWEVQQGKLQYLWRWAPCDLEVSGTVAQWLALMGDRPMPTGGCQIKGETAYLKGLQAALEQQKLQWDKVLNEDVPAPVRSVVYTLRQILCGLVPPSPWLQRDDFDREATTLRASFDRINHIERQLRAYKKKAAKGD